MFLPLHDRNPIRHIRFAYVNYSLIAATALIHLLQTLLPEQTGGDLAFQFGMIPLVVRDFAEVAPATPWGFDELTFLTYAFLHVDWWHLLANLLFLLIFGDNVEDALGHGRYLLFYLLCAVLAGLVHFAAHPYGNGPLIGASGAVAGVMGAYAVLFPRARVLVVVGVAIPIPLPLPAIWILGIWLSTQFFYAFTAAGDPVAWWAHIGGMMAGAVLGALMRRNGVRLFHRP